MTETQAVPSSEPARKYEKPELVETRIESILNNQQNFVTCGDGCGTPPYVFAS